VVWACVACNDRKSDKLLPEVKMTLRVKPYAPKGKTWLIIAVGVIEPEWEPYLAATGAVA
jgi:5-methylcytosine-specific restriction endonuclease McrA